MKKSTPQIDTLPEIPSTPAAPQTEETPKPTTAPVTSHHSRPQPVVPKPTKPQSDKVNVIVNPDQVLQAQAEQVKPKINLAESEFLSDYPPIVVTARENSPMSSATQTFDGVTSQSETDSRLFSSVRQSEQDKRQNFKPKRKKNKKRK